MKKQKLDSSGNVDSDTIDQHMFEIFIIPEKMPFLAKKLHYFHGRFSDEQYSLYEQYEVFRQNSVCLVLHFFLYPSFSVHVPHRFSRK